jgi:hypothetical protein
LSYAAKLSKQFKADLQNIGVQKKKTSDIVAEISLASKTGDLTERLQKVLNGLESVQASSVESERAFSIARRFVTKIRNRLGDKTLESYCFANYQFRNNSGSAGNYIQYVFSFFKYFMAQKPFNTSWRRGN